MPQIKQAFSVNHPRSIVWEQLQDLPGMAECLPGASLTGVPSANHADGRMTVKLGPVRAEFTGAVDIETDEENYSGKIVGTGMDKSHGSRAKGEIVYTLEEAANGAATKVSVLVDYMLAGSLAQFARGGIVDAVADRICRDFATNLETRMNAESRQAAEPAQEANSPARVEVPRKASELNALGLIMAILRRKMASLVGRA